MRRYVVDGGTAVLTGAASGIGRAVAKELSRRGAHLVLLDRDETGLLAVADELRSSRPDRAVTTYVVDLADRDATLAVAEQIRDETPHVHLLVNNAGIALAGRFDQISLEDVDAVMAVNFRAVVILTHTLLPSLVATRGSHIANVSSLFGIIAPAGQTAYSASKFAVRGFGDALRLELAEQGVGVTTVHPGGIATRIAESARIGAGVDPAEQLEGVGLHDARGGNERSPISPGKARRNSPRATTRSSLRWAAWERSAPRLSRNMMSTLSG